MLAKQLIAAEDAAAHLGVWTAKLSAGVWAGICLLKLFQREPLMYGYGSPMSAETYPILWVAAILGTSLAYVTLKGVVTGVRGPGRILPTLGGQTFACAGAVLAFWLFGGPAPGASLLPLSALTAFAGFCWYASTRGYLGEGEQIPHLSDEGVDAQPARVSRPKLKFSGIYGNEEIKARLKDAAKAIAGRRRHGEQQRNGILLHGAPGNGKTVFAEALAGELGLPLLTLTYADVASKWVGEQSVRVRGAFNQARRRQPCVFFIDEFDSFLESRDGIRGGIKEDRDIVNAILTMSVDLRRTRVILIAATNHMDRLDAAGVREGRFDFKVEITPPDLPARIGLLRSGLRKNLPSMPVDDGVIESVAQRWNGFSVKRILAVTEELPSYVQSHGLQKVGFEDIMGALRQLQGQRGHVPENVKTMDELVFDRETRETLEEIIGRMSDPEHTERHGGTLPTGILFYGPPGTGKTAACKALAKAIGWAYLPATGADLARDPKRLEALYAKAQDLRPTVIFIDEADELLRDRQFSNATEATNKLLTLMDGVGDRVRDVVWIAATNHPDQIDSALLRGGRFTEKVSFDLPSSEALGRYMQDWLARKNIRLQEGLEAYRIAEAVGACSIANAEAVLQAAVNRAVSRRQVPVTLREEDVQRAVTLVHGAA